MSRMIDRILTGELCVPPYLADGTKSQVAAIRQLFESSIPQMEVLVIDNVAEYFFATTDQETWDPTKDFPNVAPPFPLFWMEYRKPTAVTSKSTGSVSARDLPFSSVGILFDAHEQKDEDPANHWMLRGDLFLEMEKGRIIGPSYAAFFQVGLDGRMARYWIGLHHREGTVQPFPDEAIQAGILQFDPCLLALTFLHCKNVQLVPDSVPEPLARAYAKRKGRPLLRYHTLEIQPMRGVLRREGQSDKTGLKQALHICRGHFADYSKGKGLFGKWKGVYWWDAHLRGSISEGAVIKDYEVRNPVGTS